MVDISNQQFAEIVRTLTYYSSQRTTTSKEREAQRKATLLVRKLRKKQLKIQNNGIHD